MNNFSALDLVHLPMCLAAHGYADFVTSHIRFGCQMERMLAAADSALVELRPLLDLFLFGRTAQIDALPPVIKELLPALIELDIVVPVDGGLVQSTGLSLLPIFGRWVFSQQLLPSPAVYFGDDTLALMQRLTPPQDGTILDLCSGPGTLALHCAGFAREVVAVEINPAAAAVARLNVVMNRLVDRVCLYIGDLYTPVAGQRFDLITANPPLIPLPRNLPFPFVGHGGEDGLAVTRRIIREAPNYLTDTGSVQIIGTCLSDGILPAVVDALDDILPSALDVLVTVTAHMPLRRGDWQFEMLAATARPLKNRDGTLASDPHHLIEDFLERANVDHLAYFLLRLNHGRGIINVMDLSDEGNRNSLWYA